MISRPHPSPRESAPGEPRFRDLLQANVALLRVRLLTPERELRALSGRLREALGPGIASAELRRLAAAAFGYGALRLAVDDASDAPLRTTADLPASLPAGPLLLVAPWPLLGHRAVQAARATMPDLPILIATAAPLDRRHFREESLGEVLEAAAGMDALPMPCFLVRQGLHAVRLSLRPLTGPPTIAALGQALDDAVRENPAMYDWFREEGHP